MVSDQAGDVSELELLPSGELVSLRKWHAHEFPAWITAYNCWDTNTVFSGTWGVCMCVFVCVCVCLSVHWTLI